MVLKDMGVFSAMTQILCDARMTAFLILISIINKNI
jgi:hypothetical protein